MTVPTASEGFSALSLQYASVRRRRLVFVISIFFIICLLILSVFIADYFRTLAPPTQYPHSLQRSYELQTTCDSTLGKSRLFGFPAPVATALCAVHPNDPQLSASLPFAPARLTFQVLGDWGRDGMCCQRDVAFEMAAAAARRTPAFIISTGDNFYNLGIQKPDAAQVERSWRGVYIQPHRELHVPWKIVLGNHDHQGTVNAQKALSKTDPFWHIPRNYYFENYDDNDVFIAYLDTTPLYYPPEEINKDFGGFDEQAFDGQINAFRTALAGTRARFKIVIGHHPLISTGSNAINEERNMKQLRTILLHLLRDHHVTAYFSGHEHTLEHHVLQGVNLFVSGAGSKLSTIRKVANETVFALDRHGFAEVAVRNGSDVLDVSFIDLRGVVVHSAHITPGPKYPSLEEGRP